MKTNEEVQAILELIGKDLYQIDAVMHDKPIVKRIHISSVEFRHQNAYLKTDNEGSYLSESFGKNLFLTREEADKKIEEEYSGDIVKLAFLKPCPICFGKPEVKEYSHKFAVECSECGLGTKPNYKLTKAISLWNNRKGESGENEDAG